MAETSETQRNAYWESKSVSLDKTTFDLINELLIEVFSDEANGISFAEAEDGFYLYLEQTGKKNWIWKDPILHNTKDSTAYYQRDLPIPEGRLVDHLGEISIHESTMEENKGELTLYYQMYVWCWENLEDLAGCVVLSGIGEKEIEKLGDHIMKKFGFLCVEE